ncbi:MAG TPA: DUF1499 domain-containing protein [Propylenella sp.]
MRRATVVRRSRAADLTRVLGGLSLPVLVLGAIGSRVGFVPDQALLPVLALGFALALLALGTAAYAIADIWRSGADGARAAAAGIVYAAPALALLALIAAAAIVYPRLTDVTTDRVDPPAFAVADAPVHGVDAETLALQAEAFPDLGPRLYPLSVGEVYVAARDLMEERGWTLTREAEPALLPVTQRASRASEETGEIARALARKRTMTQSRSEASGGIAAAPDAAARDAASRADSTIGLEATASTPIFGFADDVVVRVRETPEGTRVDMRSASRIGEHDLGQNARRIKSFLAALDTKLQLEPGTAALSAASSARDSASE